MAYKFQWWHLAVAVVVILLLNTQYNFLGSIISGDGFTLYGESSLGITSPLCDRVEVLTGVTPYIGHHWYDFCSSKYWVYSWRENVADPYGNGGPSEGSLSGTDSSLSFSENGDSNPGRNIIGLAVTKENFNNRLFRADLNVVGFGTSSSGATSGTINVYLVNDYDVCGNITKTGTLSSAGDSISSDCEKNKVLTITSPNRDSPQSGLLEIKPSFLNVGEFGVWYKGQFLSSTTVNYEDIYVMIEFVGGSQEYGGTPTIQANNIRYQYQFSCELGPNDLLGIETFSGSQTSTLSITDLRYPIKSFCLAHPVIITSPSGSTTSAEPYQELIEGNTLNIPPDQTWTIFYVFDNTPGYVPTTCSVEQAYNINVGTCQDLGGIVQICSQGVLDPNTGTCTVTASVVCPTDYTYNEETSQCEKVGTIAQIICPTDYTYNSLTNMCEKLGNLATPTCPEGYDYIESQDVCGKDITTIEPDYEALCPEGRFDITTNTCVYNPPVQKVCEAGTWDEDTGTCVMTISVSTECPEGTVYNSALQRCEGESPVIGSQPAQDLRDSLTSETIQHPLSEADKGNWWPLIIIVLLIVILILAFSRKSRVFIKKIYYKAKRRKRK